MGEMQSGAVDRAKDNEGSSFVAVNKPTQPATPDISPEFLSITRGEKCHKP